eukprot:gnl/TRDRNA2_/TRDRNA2_188727_c0_seq1.p1 gnl/TRDRNA2_/TRDRNA2_188727_c0~~gnl/TRDRNA2_/TRDRNA2_188727_c0_seq1.p1  ORF type:complete len:177 (-),score=26.12 gnl/TRDRNA2_/TRDRNA2_188727_c0_seq1:104-634(-)
MIRFSLAILFLLGLMSSQVTGHVVANLRVNLRVQSVDAERNETRVADHAEEEDREKPHAGEEGEHPNQTGCIIIVCILVFMCCCGGALYTCCPRVAPIIGMVASIGVLIWLFYTGTMQALLSGEKMNIWCKVAAIWALVQLIVTSLLLVCICCCAAAMLANRSEQEEAPKSEEETK